jgi:hypothetical protein
MGGARERGGAVVCLRENHREDEVPGDETTKRKIFAFASTQEICDF